MGHAPQTPDTTIANRAGPGHGPIAPGLRPWLCALQAGLDRLRTRLPARLRRRQPMAAAAPRPTVERGVSPILRTATPLLALMVRLPGLPPPANPDGLRHRIIAALRRFQSAARAAGVPPDQMRAAHFILCAALDDIIGHTGWGRQAAWPERSLIRTFHKSIEPGPSLVTLLDHIQAEPARHRDELELVAVCMALGFEGRYRTLPDGAAGFRHLREDINRALEGELGPSTPELSPTWRGEPRPGPTLATVLPVWVVACLAAVLLSGLHILFAFSLGGDADRGYQRLAALLPDRPALIAHLMSPPPAPAPPAATAPAGGEMPAGAEKTAGGEKPMPSARVQRLRTALSKEAAAGQVEVADTAGGLCLIRIAGAATFTRNGDTLSHPGHDLALHLAALLDREPGRVLVVGHTDDGFTPSVRFASALALTEARARAVARVLVAHLGAPERVDIEGRADTEPLVPNTSPDSRERNRRVEILLAPGPAAGETGR